MVATPIGNLEDISSRALKILKAVDVIAAEDTRHSRKLLEKYQISTRMLSFHRHNQLSATDKVLQRLSEGSSIALISDAGTPVVSDPGQFIVSRAHEMNIQVIPVPGASALTCAISACGFSGDKFVFEGFLPSKSKQRLKRLYQLSQDERCLIFFEAPHRIVRSIADMAQVFGGQRTACVAKEMTKSLRNDCCRYFGKPRHVDFGISTTAER